MADTRVHRDRIFDDEEAQPLSLDADAV